MSTQIITSARSYIGTRFQHQGRLGKTGNHRGGMDCLGLLVNVARDCHLRSRTGQLLAEVDEFNYPHYPDTNRLREMLSMHLESSCGMQSISAGSIALFEIDGRAQHMGIISSLPLEGEGQGGGGQLVKNNTDSAPHLTSPLKGGGKAIIHAYAPARAVVEHALDDYWRQKIVGVFRVV